MKKLIGLSAAVIFSAMTFAQDTSRPAKQNLPNTTATDTIPGTTKQWNKDTSLLTKTKTQWPDTSMTKTSPDSALASTNKKWPDTSNTATTIPGKDSTSLATGNMQTPNASMDSSATKQGADDKVIMLNDKVYVLKAGDSTVLADSLTLPSGAVVKNDASVTFKDGTTTKLKNGQYIALKPAEPATPTPATEPAAKPDATTTTPPAATTAPATTTPTATTPPATAAPDNATTGTKTVDDDRVVMQDEKVYLVKSGDSTALAEDITLKSGAVVSKDGTVKFKSGATTKLKNGQFISLDPAPTDAKKEKTTKTTKTTKTKKKNS